MILDDDGFELTWLGKARRIEWREITRVRVARRLEVETRHGTLQVPRNAHGYLEIFEQLVDRKLISIPERVRWATWRSLGFLVFIGILALAPPLLMKIDDPAAYGIGFTFIVSGLITFELYTASEGCVAVSNVFGRRAWDARVLYGVSIELGPLGYPVCWVTTKSGAHVLGPVTSVVPELVSLIVNRPFQRGRASLADPPLHASEWPAGWEGFALLMIGAVAMPLLSELGVPFGVVLLFSGLCVVGSMRSLARVGEDVPCVSPNAVVFDRSREVHKACGKRNDGSEVEVHLSTEWILRHWKPNPVSFGAGYRTAARDEANTKGLHAAA